MFFFYSFSFLLFSICCGDRARRPGVRGVGKFWGAVLINDFNQPAALEGLRPISYRDLLLVEENFHPEQNITFYYSAVIRR